MHGRGAARHRRWSACGRRCATPRQRALLPQEARRSRPRARRRDLPRRRRDLPFTTKIDLRDHYPFGMFARAPRRARARARLVGHDRQPHDGGLHRAPTSPLWADLIARTLAAGGLQTRRHAAERLRLRPVHRRPRPALRRERLGCHHPAHLGRQHRPAAQDHARLRRDGPVLHAVLCALPGRRRARPRPAARRPADPRRLPRRRALDATRCAARSRRPSASTPSTSTASPRWAARASPSSAAARPACT